VFELEPDDELPLLLLLLRDEELPEEDPELLELLPEPENTSLRKLPASLPLLL